MHSGGGMDKFKLISELMELLEGEMQPSADDFGERLGRPKSVEVAIEAEPSGDEFSEEMPMDGGMESPEEKLKQRIMKLRG